jgi:hypothetical protein
MLDGRVKRMTVQMPQTKTQDWISNITDFFLSYILQNTLFDFVPSMLQVIRSIFWILLFPSVKMIPQMECHIRCSDCNEPISNFPVPRGRGGVAILWPSQRDKYIKKLTDGNERRL